MSKFDKLLVNVYGVIQLGCILSLAGIAIKRNNDAYEADCKRLDAELKLVEKDIDIWRLQHGLKEQCDFEEGEA